MNYDPAASASEDSTSPSPPLYSVHQILSSPISPSREPNVFVRAAKRRAAEKISKQCEDDTEVESEDEEDAVHHCGERVAVLVVVIVVLVMCCEREEDSWKGE